MFAIAFDLVVKDAVAYHPKGVSAAYVEIGELLHTFGFVRIQGSVYVSESEDLTHIFQAITALKALPWFPQTVRDIRAFRIEQWSDFTPIVKAP